jgi:lipocalin
MGTWYQVAWFPNRFQKQCVADTQARYRLDGERVEVINRCRQSDGSVDAVTGHAKVVEGSNNAKLVPHIGHTVEVTGDTMDMSGSLMITAADLKMVAK